MNNRELRNKISQILVKWDMPTRQAAIDEILKELESETKSALARRDEEIINILKSKRNPDGQAYPSEKGKYRNEVIDDIIYAIKSTEHL